MLLYIDPGTGSLLLTTLFGLLTTLTYTFRGFIYNITDWVMGSERSNQNCFPGQIVFFSEGKRYWPVFQPIIQEMIRRGQKVIYLSAEREDQGLSVESELVETYYLGSIRKSTFILNRLKAKMCVMTTPQIDVCSLKRSKNVEHYCHVIHSPTDIHAYKKFAFDFYDSVLCSSEAQFYNLRYLESVRNLPPKKIYKTGCTYYDVFQPNHEKGGDAILIAPTWGDRTFFKVCGIELLRNLLACNQNVIFRPHPQSWISDQSLLNEVVSEFGSHTNFVLDKNTLGENSMSESKLLICDISSGMIFDMAFAYRKPVIAIEFDWADGGYESSDLQNKNSSLPLLRDVGAVLSVKEVQNISKILDAALEVTVTPNIIKKHIFNFQESGKKSAEAILSMYKEIK